jgi:thiol-disulfide isomerase/thioredoxin
MHIAFFIALLGCGTTSSAESPSTPKADAPENPAPAAQPEPAPSVDARVALVAPEVVQQAMQDASGHVRVFNFWATWCQPCIAELPHLETMSKEYEDIEVLLVSLDHRAIGAPRVKAFLEKRGHALQSFMLDTEDPAIAMQELYPDFPGAIPITLIFDGDGDLSKAYHRGVSEEDLRKAIDAAR